MAKQFENDVAELVHAKQTELTQEQCIGIKIKYAWWPFQKSPTMSLKAAITAVAPYCDFYSSKKKIRH